MLYREPQAGPPSDNKRVIQFSSATAARWARVPLPGQGKAHAWPRALVLLWLACLLIQATVVQTHVHYVHRGPSAATGERLVQAPSSSGDDPASDCPLCREAAMAGAYVLPPAIALPAPPAPIPWTATAIVTRFVLLSPPLGWQSRAPPQ
jgi:hypothetical protein